MSMKVGMANIKARAQNLGTKQACTDRQLLSAPHMMWAPNPFGLTGQETGTCVVLGITAYEGVDQKSDCDKNPKQQHGCRCASSPNKENRFDRNCSFGGPMTFSKKPNINTICISLMLQEIKRDRDIFCNLHFLQKRVCLTHGAKWCWVGSCSLGSCWTAMGTGSSMVPL